MRLRRFWEDEYAYHITTSCRKGLRPFAVSAHAGFVADYLLEARRRDDIFLLAFCVMPDHLHVCCVPRKADLSKFMMNLKRNTSFHLKMGPVWEPRFHDRRIKSMKDLRNTIEYIHGNPVEAGLVDAPELFRFSSAGAWESLDLNLLLEFGPDV